MRRGFTLIELTVVIALLSLFAATVVPTLTAQREGRLRREFYTASERLFTEARERAINENRTVEVRFDDAQRAFGLYRPNEQVADLTVTSTPGITPQEFRNGDDPTTSSDFLVSFFPDGTTTGGSAEFVDDGALRSLSVRDNGAVAWVDGALPEVRDEKWEAGEIEKRL